MKKIVIISGDPNSINSELIYKVWKKIDKSVKRKIYLISNYDLLIKQYKKLKLSVKLIKVRNLNENQNTNKLKVINVNLFFKDPFKVSNQQSSKFFVDSINLAHKYSTNREIKGFINCPIDKKLLNKKTGVTEFLASKCSVKDNSEVMLIRNKNLAVSPITTHIDIKTVSRNITSKKIIAKITTIESWFKKNLKRKPKIAVLGLNPHNSEFKKDSEELKIIKPAILKLKKNNIRVSGPYASDAFFINDYKKYDVIVGMYRDQILTPFKTLFGFDAINLTLGLDYLRISPDHGVATNLIGKNKANASSLLSCINYLNKF